MKNRDCVVVIQCQSTGRLLLRENEGTWTIGAQLTWSPDVANFFATLCVAQRLMGLESMEDIGQLEYIGVVGGRDVFYGSVEEELLAPGEQGVAWYALYDFPENSDDRMEDLFAHNYLMERLVAA